MSAAPVVAPRVRGRWSSAARAWLRPLPLIGAALAIVATTTLAVLRHAIPAEPDEVIAADFSVATASAVLCWLAGTTLGFTWKRQVCRPQARLMPGWRATHAAVAATAIAAVAVPALAAAIAGGIAPLAATALTVLPTALGALLPFSMVGMMLQGPAIIAVAAVLAAHANLRTLDDALAGRRSGIPGTALALGACGIAWLVRRVAVLDEDDVAFHVQLAFGPPPVDAVRESVVMRWIRAWDRRARAAAPVRPLAASTSAWAWHRRALFVGTPWTTALAGDVALMAVAAWVPDRETAIYLALLWTMMTPASAFGRMMVPGFAQAAPLEALRPAARRRDVASMLAAMLLVQARSLALMAPCAAVAIALRDPRRLVDLVAATLAAALCAPAIAVAGLAATTLRRVGARHFAIVGVFIGFLVVVCVLQITVRRPGWLCALGAIADLAVVPPLWRRLMRIDIE